MERIHVNQNVLRSVVGIAPGQSVALALALLGAPVIFAPAYGGGIEITNCFGAFRTFSCVTQWGAARRSPPAPRARPA